MSIGLAELAIVLLIGAVMVGGVVLFVVAVIAGQRRSERGHDPTS